MLGVRSLFGHTVGGAAGAVSRITGAVGKRNLHHIIIIIRSLQYRKFNVSTVRCIILLLGFLYKIGTVHSNQYICRFLFRIVFKPLLLILKIVLQAGVVRAQKNQRID